MAEKPPDFTKDPEFQRVLRNLLNMPTSRTKPS